MSEHFNDHVECILRHRSLNFLLSAVLEGPPDGKKVLDVGGVGLLQEHIPTADVTTVNIDRRSGGRVVGDARKLRLPTRSFDIVVLCDTFDHVAPEDRQAVLEEAARVSRDIVIIIGPWDGDITKNTEASILDTWFVFEGNALKQYQRPGQWRLPMAKDFPLPQNYSYTTIIPVTPVELVTSAQLINFSGSIIGPSVNQDSLEHHLEALNYLTNEFGPLEVWGPTYRQAWIARRNEPIPELATFLQTTNDPQERIVMLADKVVSALESACDRLDERAKRAERLAQGRVMTLQKEHEDLQVEVSRLRKNLAPLIEQAEFSRTQAAALVGDQGERLRKLEEEVKTAKSKLVALREQHARLASTRRSAS